MGRHVSEDGDNIADYAQHTEPGAHPFDVSSAVDASAPAVASEPEWVEALELSDGPVTDDAVVDVGLDSVQPWMSELDGALAETGYQYRDPAADTDLPRISEPDPADALPDAFPDGWGEAPTERDQAAIDAGNA